MGRARNLSRDVLRCMQYKQRRAQVSRDVLRYKQGRAQVYKQGRAQVHASRDVLR